MLQIPDCYVLVEGVSDEICYDKFIELYNDSDYRINVIDCKGKTGVYKKYRGIVKEEHYIGSIVTILDSDATKQHEDIMKIKKGKVLTHHHKYKNGSLEDLFSKKLILKVLNELYPGKPKLTIKELNPQIRMEDTLKKIVWEQRDTEFDKTKFAKAIAVQIERKSLVPNIAKFITEQIIKITEQRVKSKPRTQNLISIQGKEYKRKIMELKEIYVSESAD